MTPMEAALADVWQPFHRAVAPENVKYNPLHPAWGQDPRMAAKQVETAAAQTKEAAGGTAWRADPVDPTQAGQLPGRLGVGLGGGVSRHVLNLQGMQPSDTWPHRARDLRGRKLRDSAHALLPKGHPRLFAGQGAHDDDLVPSQHWPVGH